MVTGEYEVGMQDQAFLGPESGLAVPAEDGGIDLWIATQWLHVDRDQVAACLDLPVDKVRFTLAGVGGAFGGREDVSMQAHACMLALHTGKPVKMVYGREESFFGHVHRHPARLRYEHGATRDGRLAFIRARILLDGGAYASSSSAVCSNAASFALGPYEVPSARIDAYVVYTDNPPCGAMRGFGAVQTCFAHEAQMDKLAAELGIDPVELRLRNAMTTGTLDADRRADQLPGAGARAARVGARARPLPEGGGGVPGGIANVTRGEGVVRGVGYAVGFKNVGFSEGFDDFSTARVRLSLAGGEPLVEVHTAAAEVGQGLVTVMAQIARTELGVAERAGAARGHPGRLRRLVVGLAPDPHDRRRGAGGVHRRARGAGSGSAARSATASMHPRVPPPPHASRSTSSARATRTSRSRSPRTARWSTWMSSSGSCGWSRSRPRRTSARR